ncbi:hypothetical protein ZOSMA_133G00700 [Zostera marina]|uniref:Uncharacterized protein n=1 Tax=Zostera marina TaxID=29655 RepID=A0A0K9PYZ0_ZOSMR|nr:hypothetical protein ZOSMA_133G00700 [Zostera marina]
MALIYTDSVVIGLFSTFHALPRSSISTHITCARKGVSSRSSRRGKKDSLSVKSEPPPVVEKKPSFEIEDSSRGSGGVVMGYKKGAKEGELTPMPKLEGLEKNFFEGPQMDAVGFVFQYLWAFGIVFALVACGIAVSTYNEGATDFKKTPSFKESVQSQDLLEESESFSSSDVFEGNPTEAAPSLD